ncbi:Uncharacterised protein [uncultured Avibacterium sp.]|uniref:Uncharacterized protein n=1 Tax=uncultured Avibacterium sp. TaxID=1936169 RepID=A0A486XHC1_9PAST|nr:Uncharacterised protein [uncultured Avibacterium sp.]
MEKAKTYFLELINPQKTQVKDKLNFVWVFGAGGGDVLSIDKIDNKLNPGHPDFIPYQGITSNRAKFIQWSKANQHDICELLQVPEMYSDWLNFNQYTNLVDFELDITRISLGTIIFSESIGTYTEIGMFSCLEKLHKNILIISQEKYLREDVTSFFNYGAIKKIEENKISDELTNIWGLPCENKSPKELDNLFSSISDHFLDIITSYNKETFDNTDMSHITLLLLDLIDLFPSNNLKFYKSILNEFKINIENNQLKRIIDLLKLLGLISQIRSGSNTLYNIKIHNYTSCIKYTANNPKRFERSDFKISIRKK